MYIKVKIHDSDVHINTWKFKMYNCCFWH